MPLSGPVSASRLLSRATLRDIPDTVRIPPFDVGALRTGIVHLGCGNFHRAHQVAATHAAIAAEGEAGLKWGIASAGMRSADLTDRLTAQDGLFTLLHREPDRTDAVVIGGLTDTFFAGQDEIGLPARIAAPQTRIVTLTVTASGYYLTADGRLDPENPAIRADLGARRPRSAVGALAKGLALVQAQETTPPTVLCCDNLPHNGAVLMQAVCDFARLGGDDGLADWIAQTVRFPTTMVDRIVPATKPEELTDARTALGGIVDLAPVASEPWFQWVIEDFDGPRPLWEAAGARFVADVTPFETAKLRMLNGTHMLLAYAGALAGCDTVAEAANHPVIGPIAGRFMRREQSIGVAFSPEALDTYAHDLMVRFRNPSIVHRMGRIGRNGSAKMASRVVEPMRENLAVGRPVTDATFLIACWIRWLILHERDALDLPLEDPRLARLCAICADARDDHVAQAEAFLAMEEVFGPPLPDHTTRVQDIASLLQAMAHEPANTVFARHLAG